ncbi:hypothetical protein L6452_12345 [Arctium lappa]|uniref:Uncharacterized protein n=1 Tax=Arctium lappa TaxID=4217 RepID=A0ACB9DQG4_ARCLA|nr:hypothetical protein L6452_12345 [Arctium lappa]
MWGHLTANIEEKKERSLSEREREKPRKRKERAVARRPESPSPPLPFTFSGNEKHLKFSFGIFSGDFRRRFCCLFW